MQRQGRLARWVPDVVLALLALALTVRYALVTWLRREPWEATYPYRTGVLTDFRDTVMLPWEAIRKDANPYDIAVHTRLFPHAQEFDPYAPWWLTATHPFAMFGWDTATLLWSVFSALLISAGAFLAGVWIVGRMRCQAPGSLPWITPGRAALFMVVAVWLWRPTTVGHGLGNVGAMAALCAVLALMSRRDDVAGVMLALAWVKPQFGIPVLLAMLARGHWRRALLGTGVAVLASVPIAIRLARIAGGFDELVASVLRAVEELGARTGGEPLEGRVDLVQPLTALHLPAGSMAVMAVGAVLVVACARADRWLARRGRPALGLLLVCLAILLGFPHLHYDLPMLLPALAWVAWEQWAAWRQDHPAWTRWLVAAVVLATGLLGVVPLGSFGISMTFAQAMGVLFGFVALVATLPWTSRRPALRTSDRNPCLEAS